MGIAPSDNALRLMRSRRKGPAYVKTGDVKCSRVYYLRADVEAWLVAHRIDQ